MTDHLGKQGGRGAGIWALKQQLFALVCCCVPLVLFWIARLVSVPFSLFCHRFLPALLQPGLLYPTTCSSSPGQKGKVSKVARNTSSGQCPSCHVIETKPPFCPSGWVRDMISAGNYSWRRGGCPAQWHRGCEGREGGRLRDTSTAPIFTCHVLAHRQAQTENAGAFWGKDAGQCLHSSCSSPCCHSDPISASGKDWWVGWFKTLWL